MKPSKKDKKDLLNLMSDLDFLFGINAKNRELRYKDSDKKVNDISTICEILVEEDYNRVTIYIYPIFWDKDQKERASSIIHEYCHILVNPLHDVAQNLIDGKLETWEHKRVAWEKSVCSIEYLITGFLSGKFKWAKKSFNSYLKSSK